MQRVRIRKAFGQKRIRRQRKCIWDHAGRVSSRERIHKCILILDFQVDKRFHRIDPSKGIDNVAQGAQILADNLQAVEKKHPSWTKEQQLRGAVTAYNFGVKNVKTVERLDIGTSDNNYSRDVLARADALKKVFNL